MKIPSGIKFIGREGDALPGEDLGGCPIGGEFVEQSTDQIFGGKKVVVFALPGAFTPTCSSQQLPGYEKMYDEFKDLGIDEIYCLSVNDGFVMNAWFAQDGITKVKPLCDGNYTFTTEMGKLNDMRVVGFGIRSKRYAMVVNDGIVEHMFTEPDASVTDPDPYGVSSPENVIDWLRN